MCTKNISGGFFSMFYQKKGGNDPILTSKGFKGWLKLQLTKPPGGYGFLPNGGALVMEFNLPGQKGFW